jgi:hypothetical protein
MCTLTCRLYITYILHYNITYQSYSIKETHTIYTVTFFLIDACGTDRGSQTPHRFHKWDFYSSCHWQLSRSSGALIYFFVGLAINISRLRSSFPVLITFQCFLSDSLYRFFFYGSSNFS